MLLVAKKPASEKAGADTRSEQINVRIPSALLDRLDRIAEPFGLRRSDLLRTALMEYVQRQEALLQEQKHQQPTRR